MPTTLNTDAFDNAADDLEEALNAIDQIAEILGALEGEPIRKTVGSTPKIALEYLADRHREEAMDAFRRIYGLDQHSPQRAGDDAEAQS
jgi:hypothetical protein